MPVTFAHIAVRRAQSDGREFFDIQTLDHTEELAQAKIDQQRHETPKWQAANPIVRVVRVRIEEA